MRYALILLMLATACLGAINYYDPVVVGGTADGVTYAEISWAGAPSGWTDTTSPNAIYYFEETNGTSFYYDMSGNSYTGTPQPSVALGPYITNIGARAEGGTESVIGFDGVNDYVNLNAVVSDIQSDTNGTIMYWVYHPSITGNANATFSATDSGDASSYMLVKLFGVGITGTFSFEIVENGTEYLKLTCASVFTINTWHHVAVTVSSSGNAIYIDGIKRTPTYVTGNASTVKWFDTIPDIDVARLGSLRIGNVDYFGFAGKIDDFYYKSSALTSNEVYTRYSNTLHPTNSIETRLTP